MTSEHKPFSWLRTREFWIFFAIQFVVIVAVAYILSPYKFTAFELQPSPNFLGRLEVTWSTFLTVLLLAQLLTAALLPKIAFWKMCILVILNASSFFLQPYGSIGFAVVTGWQLISIKWFAKSRPVVKGVLGVLFTILAYLVTIAALEMILLAFAVISIIITLSIALSMPEYFN
jgi:hypothetical protein